MASLAFLGALAVKLSKDLLCLRRLRLFLIVLPANFCGYAVRCALITGETSANPSRRMALLCEALFNAVSFDRLLFQQHLD